MNSNPLCNDNRCTRGDALFLRPSHRSLEDEHGVTLSIALPGVQRDGLSVTSHGGRLLVDARRPATHPEGWTVLRAAPERRYRLALRLSPRLDGEAIDASLNDGVLTLRVPVREEAKPRQIEIA